MNYTFVNSREITLPIVPPTATAQQKGVFVRNGHAHFYTKAKVKNAENFLATMLLPYRPSEPYQGPVALHIEWHFPYRKSEKKRIVNFGDDVAHTSRPDLDNLEKNCLDTMTRLAFWNDDSQIAMKTTMKFWSKQPCLKITIANIVIYGYSLSRIIADKKS